jgi:biopolymer transport protein ExbB
MSLIWRGGWPMILLLVCSLAAITVIVERLLILIPLRRRTRTLVDRLDPLFREGRLDQAESVCRDHAGLPLADILGAGFLRTRSAPDAWSAAVHEAAAVEVPALHVRLWFLAAIAQVSTLLGLLGTVIGMIAAFHAVEARGAAGQMVGPGDLAGGIWVSLLCTAAGLLIAVPSYFAYYGLGSLVNAMTSRMERCAHEGGEALLRRRGGMDPQAGALTPGREARP